VGGHLLKPYVAEDELLWLNGERHGARASADPSRTADRVTLELLTLMRSPSHVEGAAGAGADLHAAPPNAT
jgi:hypothetical protein